MGGNLCDRGVYLSVSRRECMTLTASMTLSPNCPHCGNIHQGKCPLVRAIEYHENGTIKRIEYMAPADYGAPISAYGPSQNLIPVQTLPVPWPNITAR